ncbi:MAG: UvrD-helicase domain-containing protein [Prevotella sp.]|nr:UvrD-helicase domain-containing protein [Prevotella sp.]
MRNRLKTESDNFDYEISQSLTIPVRSSYDVAYEKANQQNECQFDDIESAIEKVFDGCYVSSSDEEHFIDQFTPVFNDAYTLKRKLETFKISPSYRLEKLISDYESIHSLLKKHNETIIKARLDQNKDYFDHCLTYPLDGQQRRSIVSEENNCLVVSSAGSGKTSSIVGKVKYLTEKLNINPERILLISYTNKAAAELTDRMDIPGLRGYTFHKLALDLIGQVTGQKPSICENTDALFVSIYRELLKNEIFRESVVEYFVDYQLSETDWEKRKSERRQDLIAQKANTLKSIFPDMDGNPIYVRSQQEQKLCFALSSLSIKFRYEEQYEHKVADETHAQYKPDFSIYYDDHGKMRRAYLEHFGVDEHGLVPVWFAKDKGITYEEANERYGDGITWKKAVHEKFGTTLLITTSADFYYTDIKDSLKKVLGKHGIPYQEKSAEELYDLIIPEGSKQEKAFIRLVVTFITLLKSSCKSLDNLLNKTDDQRSLFIIKNIFRPVYDRYVDELRRRGQIDFTDAILNATDLCRRHHPVQYDYIIVDEFQDISVDRYQFLLALREGNPPAKLYCVGDDWQSIYRFSGSDMALFNSFSEFFGPTEINKIETTYRFGEPLVSLSSEFIQKNKAQIKKNIHPFNSNNRTELAFHGYERNNYCNDIGRLVDDIPEDKSIFLLGRYSFDDYYLSFMYQSVKENGKFYYIVNGRKIEFLTVHKSKGLEADYVIVLQCNKDVYGFPSQVSDDPVLDIVLTKSDKFPFGEERRLFYVAITRAKIRTIVMYDKRYPSVFVDEFLNPEKVTEKSYAVHPNANKTWTRGEDRLLLAMYQEGKDIKYISRKMGRSQTSIIMRLGKLGAG